MIGSGFGGATPLAAPPGFSVPGQEPDVLDRLVRLVTGDPRWLYVLAGIGFKELKEIAGKPMVKPHRSNEELADRGYPVGRVGQTGMPDISRIAAQLRPPAVPGMGPASLMR